MKLAYFAFALFHTAAPLICVALYDASPFWIVGGLLFAVAVVRTTQRSSIPATKLTLCIVSGLFMWLNLMLGTSFYTQGTGFNDQFFYHLDFNTLIIAARAYSAVFFSAILSVAVALFAPLILYPAKSQVRPGARQIILFWVAALVTVYPVFSYVNYRMGFNQEMSDLMPRIPTSEVGAAAQTPAASERLQKSSTKDSQVPLTEQQSGKNIIVIYAEGLEQLYFDQSVFGDIVPNLTELSKQAYQFTNTYQVPGATWTIAGIVASQCGFPLVVGHHLASNSTMASTEKPFENEVCLGDILLAEGYETAFLGGAPLAFAGKGNFLRTHGYRSVRGWDELRPMLPDPTYHMGWGLYDDSLFEIALEQLQTLESGDKPYLLTLLTLDTHHPEGHPSKTCRRLKNNPDPISNAIFCSDQLISRFINKAMQIAGMDDTVIVLFSDHLAMRNTLWGKLRKNKRQRRLTWMIFDNQPPAQSDLVATHFDFTPTVLQKAGINGYATLNQGVSLFTRQASNRTGKPAKVDAAEIPRSLVSNESVKESGFSINYKNLTIGIGELSIKVSKNGWDFSSGVFLIILDEDGKVVDTLYLENFTKIPKELEGRLVVGVSVLTVGPRHDDRYFFGRISEGLEDLRFETLDSDVTMTAEQLGF